MPRWRQVGRSARWVTDASDVVRSNSPRSRINEVSQIPPNLEEILEWIHPVYVPRASEADLERVAETAAFVAALEEQEEEEEENPPDELLSSTRAENARALLAAQLPNPRSYNQQAPSREAMLADLNLLDPDQVDGPPQTDDQVHRRVISNMLGAAHRSREAWQLSRTLIAANISVAANSEEEEEEEEDNGERDQESDEAPSPSRLRRDPVSELERIHHSANGAIMCRAVSRDPKPTHINFLHKLVCQFIDLRENRGGEDRPPNEFLCPLSLHAMCDPVVLSDGILYERAYARRSLDADQISPVTREPLPHKLMFPCKALITLMESWVRLRVDVPEGSSLVVELQGTLDKHAPTEKRKEVD